VTQVRPSIWLKPVAIACLTFVLLACSSAATSVSPIPATPTSASIDRLPNSVRTAIAFQTQGLRTTASITPTVRPSNAFSTTPTVRPSTVVTDQVSLASYWATSTAIAIADRGIATSSAATLVVFNITSTVVAEKAITARARADDAQATVAALSAAPARDPVAQSRFAKLLAYVGTLYEQFCSDCSNLKGPVDKLRKPYPSPSDMTNAIGSADFTVTEGYDTVMYWCDTLNAGQPAPSSLKDSVKCAVVTARFGAPRGTVPGATFPTGCQPFCDEYDGNLLSVSVCADNSFSTYGRRETQYFSNMSVGLPPTCGSRARI
jgi:hypothetical protein